MTIKRKLVFIKEFTIFYRNLIKIDKNRGKLKWSTLYRSANRTYKKSCSWFSREYARKWQTISHKIAQKKSVPMGQQD